MLALGIVPHTSIRFGAESLGLLSTTDTPLNGYSTALGRVEAEGCGNERSEPVNMELTKIVETILHFRDKSVNQELSVF